MQKQVDWTFDTATCNVYSNAKESYVVAFYLPDQEVTHLDCTYDPTAKTVRLSGTVSQRQAISDRFMETFDIDADTITLVHGSFDIPCEALVSLYDECTDNSSEVYICCTDATLYVMIPIKKVEYV